MTAVMAVAIAASTASCSIIEDKRESSPKPGIEATAEVPANTKTDENGNPDRNGTVRTGTKGSYLQLDMTNSPLHDFRTTDVKPVIPVAGDIGPTGKPVGDDAGYIRPDDIELPDAAWLDPQLEMVYTDQEIKDGYAFMVDFIAHEVIDSPSNGGGQTADEWFDENKHLIAPEWQDDFRRDLNSRQPLINPEAWQQESGYEDYGYIYDENETRIHNLKITPLEIFAVGMSDYGPVMATKVYVTYDMPVEFVDRNGKKKQGIQQTYGFMSYAARQDEENPDKWLIGGYNLATTTLEPLE